MQQTCHLHFFTHTQSFQRLFSILTITKDGTTFWKTDPGIYECCACIAKTILNEKSYKS